jgi:hypothetical protein
VSRRPVLDGAASPWGWGPPSAASATWSCPTTRGKPTRMPLGFVCPPADTASCCLTPVGQAIHQPALYDLIAATETATVPRPWSRAARRAATTSAEVQPAPAAAPAASTATARECPAVYADLRSAKSATGAETG